MSYYEDIYLRVKNNKELPITTLEKIAKAVEDLGIEDFEQETINIRDWWGTLRMVYFSF